MWLAVSYDHRRGRDAHTLHFHPLHIVRTVRIVPAGFARVAIKELLLRGVPQRRMDVVVLYQSRSRL